MEYGLVIGWWVLFGLLALLGVPIAGLVFSRFHDYGGGFSLVISLSLFLFLVYWLGRLRYSFVVLMGILGIIGLLAVICYTRVEFDTSRLAESFGVFTLGYLLIVFTRSLDPSIRPAGGEKFLDYGLLLTILRSTTLPPMDMWFAGEPVQYYYGGHLLAASLSFLTSTPPQFAYNLALAGFYGTLLMTVYSFAGNVTHRQGGSFRLGGGLAAFFVGFASNLVTPVQTLLALLPTTLSRTIAEWLGIVTALDPAWFLALTESINVPFYWTASRVIPGTINEFPLFAWINGDLHAHMMSLPFFVLAIAIVYASYDALPNHRTSRRIHLFGFLPLIAALLAILNTWDVPTILGVTWLGVYFATPATTDSHSVTGTRLSRLGSFLRSEFHQTRTATVSTVLVLLLAIILVFPFFTGPALGASGRSLGMLPPRSGFVPFFLIYGWFIGIFAVYLGYHYRDSLHVSLYHLLIFVGVFLFGISTNTLVLISLVFVMVLAWRTLRYHSSPGFELVLLLAGAGLLFLVELVYLQEQAGPGRMNTVFKIYTHVWILWALAAGIMLTSLHQWSGSTASSKVYSQPRIQVLLVCSVLVLSIYGLVVIGGLTTTTTQPSLDATQWAVEHHPEEWEAIEWLNEQPGQPHIVSLPGCSCHTDSRFHLYRWVNAESSFTGIPTVAGWSHEIGYRGETAYLSRVRDVNEIYTGTPQDRTVLLDQYDVQYIWVGPNERAYYNNPTFAGPEYTIVFQNRAVTVYAVNDNTAP